MYQSVRRYLLGRLSQQSMTWQVLKASYHPVAWTTGTTYRWGSRRFSRPPVIIGGAPRSGTTILLSVLSAHRHIQAIPHETFAFCPPRTPSRAHSPDDFELHRVYAPLALSPSESTATRWAEKTPRNVLSFGAILDHFGEDVRLIHIVRDGRDATTSRHLRDPATYYYDAGSWAATVSHGLQFRDHPQVTLVRYEDLVLDFAATTARLCTFLDEPVDRQIVDWFNHASVRTHTAWRGSVQSMYDTSIGRWRRPEHARQVELFYKNARAMALLAELGYDSEA